MKVYACFAFVLSLCFIICASCADIDSNNDIGLMNSNMQQNDMLYQNTRSKRSIGQAIARGFGKGMARGIGRAMGNAIFGNKKCDKNNPNNINNYNQCIGVCRYRNGLCYCNNIGCPKNNNCCKS